jgi:phosphoglycerate dehydrogenase-like enzyme
MTQKTFRVAFTRDYLNDSGEVAYGDLGLSRLDESPQVEYHFLDEYRDPVTPEQIKSVDALSIIYPHVTQETFAEGAERLTVVGRCGAGYDRIDLEACTAAGVALVNAPNALRFPAASAALMFILVLSKRLWELDRLVRRGRWDLRSEVMGIELRGRTLGIVGLGSIGRELVKLVAPMAMHVLAHDPYADSGEADAIGVTMVSLDKLLRESDFVSLHCPLTEETRGLIGTSELASMKRTAYLINMARGPVVDHQALAVALANGRIAGAGLDVFCEEPLPADDPLTEMENVVLSPHWAAGTLDVFHDAVVSNVSCFLQVFRGEVPDHVVNTDVIDHPVFQDKLARFRSDAA